jgi:hypothetical protein
VGAALRLWPEKFTWLSGLIATPFYDMPASQILSLVLFIGLCLYLWVDSTRKQAEKSS